MQAGAGAAPYGWTNPKMAVGKNNLPAAKPISGFRLGTASAGIKTVGRLDLVVMELCASANVAAVFTQNAFCAAPVQVAKQHLNKNIHTRYFIVNTGNANAGTGEPGIHDALSCCQALAEKSGSDIEQVLPFSTGVIGEPLPVEKITAALPQALADLSEQGWLRAAEGIMTTDTRPKLASHSCIIDGQQINITGIAKGAGMIKPNMATMLAYIATDACIEQSLLQRILEQAVNRSFNRITVDGDTSTNDACMLVASGDKKLLLGKADESDDNYQAMLDAISEVCIELAQGLVRDGEGASKFVTVDVSGGLTTEECLQVAYTVAESPLVKTALFASDANWGRILAAIGRAGVKQLDVNAISVFINDVLIAENGCRALSYTEDQGCSAMENEEITISIKLARGQAQERVWTTDLSHEYVRINAEYRT